MFQPLTTSFLNNQLAGKIRDQAVTSDINDTLKLTEDILLRNKRNVKARLVMANISLSKGDVQSYIDWFIPIFSIERDNAKIYAEELGRKSNIPSVLKLTLNELKEKPFWGHYYINYVSELDIFPYGGAKLLYLSYPELQTTYLNKMLLKGEYSAAYEAFKLFAGAKENEVPFDQNFIKQEGPLPFNWAFDPQYAELKSDGGVYISYYGRGQPNIMRQILPLNPGNYTFKISASGNMKPSQGSFVWNIVCYQNSVPILEMPMLGLQEAHSISSAQFTIPGEGCDLQTLYLLGKPGQFPVPTHVELHYAKIDKIFSSQISEHE